MLSRRQFLQTSGAAAALAFWAPTTLTAGAAAVPAGGPPILINLFLRGGADGLALVPPVGDPRCSAAESNPVSLNGDYFALHPSFAPLFTSIPKTELTGVHAVHTGDTSLSHFNAMARSDRGNEPAGPGWMMGAAIANGLMVPLNNVTLGTTVNPSLLGGPSATLTGVSDLLGVANTFESIIGSIERMWSGDAVPTLLTNTAGDLIQLVDDVGRFGPDNSAAEYPDGPEGVALKEAARLIRESPSVAHIAINSGSINNGSRWDTHAGQVNSLNTQIRDMAEAIAVFRQDVGEHWDRIVIVIQTEFGRTVHANNIVQAGTQHGHAAAMLLVGGPIANSPYSGDIAVAEWPGLANPFEGRYLAMTADIRTVLSEVLAKHMQCLDVDSVFPTFDAAANPEIGVLASLGEPGDADGDGTVDGADVESVLARLVGDTDNELYETLADFDRNRAIELRDALLIAQDAAN